MTEGEDLRLREVATLTHPTLPSARAREILLLARAQFLTGTSAPESLAAPRRWHATLVVNVLAATMLGAFVTVYLAWTALTLSSLQPSQHSVLWERAGSM